MQYHTIWFLFTKQFEKIVHAPDVEIKNRCSYSMKSLRIYIYSRKPKQICVTYVFVFDERLQRQHDLWSLFMRRSFLGLLWYDRHDDDNFRCERRRRPSFRYPKVYRGFNLVFIHNKPITTKIHFDFLCLALPNQYTCTYLRGTNDIIYCII